MEPGLSVYRTALRAHTNVWCITEVDPPQIPPFSSKFLFFQLCGDKNEQIKLAAMYGAQRDDLINTHKEKGAPHSVNQHTTPAPHIFIFFVSIDMS